jgi:hypothetical protein
MKKTLPPPSPVKQEGRKDPNWLAFVYAIGTVCLIIMWAYIISKKI